MDDIKERDRALEEIGLLQGEVDILTEKDNPTGICDICNLRVHQLLKESREENAKLKSQRDKAHRTVIMLKARLLELVNECELEERLKDNNMENRCDGCGADLQQSVLKCRCP
jgi:hypothetical protein